MEQNNLELLKNEMVRYSVLLITNNDKRNGSECNFQQNISKCCVDFYYMYVLLNAFVYLIWKLKKQSSFISPKTMLLHISDVHSVITFMFQR